MGIVQSRAGEGDGGVREVFIGGIKGGTPLQSCQPSLGMGSLGGPHARSGSVRGAPRQPMPDAAELERRFTKVLILSIKKRKIERLQDSSFKRNKIREIGTDLEIVDLQFFHVPRTYIV
ncbi:hypothetical protein WN51_01720 [Melipona quadrifasciata]|uniref:Uncharacterized protein n=1 Tax=Melipona quadrifasciata TaxID=166423 RepID=A0A0M8ZWF7_9HYME|nr:hypothetical protein WN51_01720 [Melipona quadrifasciata]